MNEDIYVLGRDDYPPTLANMKGRPKKLFARGALPEDGMTRRYLCVIGSRQWTSYGRDSVSRIIDGLRGYPISIVSGLAIGIDSISHMAALKADLHCIAFPGSCLDWDAIYPASHLWLAKEIVRRGGLLLSPWEVGRETGDWAFPARNKLMAGISHATLIVEAAQGSGSLMTAEHAEKCDRDIFAIPGPINAAQSYGPHMLIKRGAALISSSEDVLENLGFAPKRASSVSLVDLGKRRGLGGLPIRILDVVSREELTIDMLHDRLKTSPADLNEGLSCLEIEELIKIEGGVIKPAI